MIYRWFCSGDKVLIKYLCWFKKYSLWKNLGEFLKIDCNRERVGLLLTEIWETCSTDQRHETGRLKHTHTEKNMATVDEMVSLLNHNGQKQTLRSTRQISKETDLTKRSIVHIIHCIFGRNCSIYQHACCLLLLVFLAFVFHKLV